MLVMNGLASVELNKKNEIRILYLLFSYWLGIR